MKFRIENWTVKQLVDSYDKGILDLNPPYQRRFIWSLKDQQTLIDSIMRGYAIPNIFLFENSKKKLEMVDGQQRTRTIFGFIKNDFKTFDGDYYNVKAFGSKILNYTMPVTIIEGMEKGESVEEFYALVNKAGIHLNRPELKKAEHFDTLFLKLITELSGIDDFNDLDLFTEGATKRMNDVDFVSELVSLIVHGITDKKIKVDKLFESDISETDYKKYKDHFIKILKHLKRFNKLTPLKNTRYKQRNDFYTLFGFVNDNLNEKTNTLSHFYQLLVEFNDYIAPSTEKCEPFQEYAFHCVSQSNSKAARDERAKILSGMFLNKSKKANKIQKMILKFYSLDESALIDINGFLTFDLNKIKASIPSK